MPCKACRGSSKFIGMRRGRRGGLTAMGGAKKHGIKHESVIEARMSTRPPTPDRNLLHEANMLPTGEPWSPGLSLKLCPAPQHANCCCNATLWFIFCVFFFLQFCIMKIVQNQTGSVDLPEIVSRLFCCLCTFVSTAVYTILCGMCSHWGCETFAPYLNIFYMLYMLYIFFASDHYVSQIVCICMSRSRMCLLI